jgi:nicotinamidase-related amidase
VIRKTLGICQSRARSGGDGHLILCALATNGCVNADAIHARALGYDVTVIEDAHGTTDGCSGKKAAEIIPLFGGEWRRVGVRLVKARALDFARS